MRAGVLEPTDSWLVYASRVMAEPMDALAAQVGHSERWGWRRRRQAKDALVDAGPELVGAGR